MTKRFVLACASLALLLAVGCGGKVRFPNYYTLALAPSLPPGTNRERKLGSVAVRDFETPAYLRQGRIVYRESPTEVGFYEFHRWVTDPGATITIAIIDSLRSSGPFSAVDSNESHVRPDFLLRGRLERLDEIDYSGGVRVEVKLSAQLIDLRNTSTVWTGDEAESGTVEKATVNSVVVEMSHAAQKCIDRLLADMEQQVTNTVEPASSEIPRSNSPMPVQPDQQK